MGNTDLNRMSGFYPLMLAQTVVFHIGSVAGLSRLRRITVAPSAPPCAFPCLGLVMSTQVGGSPPCRFV